APAGAVLYFHLLDKDFNELQRMRSVVQLQPGEQRSCVTCHGTDLTKPGKHATTGKPIEPLAVSANSERLTDPAKVEKWFGRNCRWTLGRDCTPQEKGDFVRYIQSL
ncbi:MAG: DUF1924 domain-containing protein, partial [Lamprocystis purpurea]|nr:DUF1924 domain-containing protein [Lamprocystis purpurea]